METADATCKRLWRQSHRQALQLEECRCAQRYRLKKLREQLRSRIKNSLYPPPPPWSTPLCLCSPGTPSSTRNLPPGYRGGEYDMDPFQSGGALPRLPLLSLPANPRSTGSQPSP